MENSLEQETRTFLRSRTLYFISALCASNARCNIRMYDNTDVSCVVKAIDLDFENIIVDELKTPFARTAKSARLRIADIISIEMDRSEALLKLE
ncbi:hypothetical protein HHI36_014943 [Cryptolaemus montrouzieri]|uniref:Uncharacterized protein n=1 Tax=Cryptolaemus montrouzieri TaxID=559131 RepID=A0ABD2N4L4_9CUCU